MLIQFSVSNFMSLKDEVVLSMVAGSNKEHSEYVFDMQGEALLPTVAIYGSNAAGKSNIFKAMTAAIVTIRQSNIRQINEPIRGIVPFSFDKTSNTEVTKFDFIFVKKGRKFQYGFAVDTKKVHQEYLYEYKSSRPSMIFERSEGDVYEFTKLNEKILKQYESKNTPNKLFLATATSWNCDLTKDAYMWFAEDIDTYNELSLHDPKNLERVESGGESLKNFMKALLKNADINISDYKIKSEIVKNPIEIPMPPGLQIQLDPAIIGKKFEVSTSHDIETTDGEMESYLLPLEAESEGTQKLFMFAPIIKDALEKGRIIVFDELDNSLHPLMLDYLIELFNNKESNPNGAQLIFNTHSVNTMSLDKFRRDQIYFVEKNNKTGITELYSLDEFSVRQKENIRKGYLVGRYGAIPSIGMEGLEW